jgi:hypothetical protein
MNKDKVIAAIAWYRPEQWQRLREISSDVENIEDTYEEWLTKAEEMIRKADPSHVVIEKVECDVEEVLAWCNERRLEVDGKSRSQFAAEKSRKAHETSS